MSDHRILVLLVLSVGPGWTWADGGAIRLSELTAGYRVTVFSEPSPLRAGPVDISVLLQDAETAETILDADVIVRLRRRDGLGTERAFGRQAKGPSGRPALRELATNKLYYAAPLELARPGGWVIEVDIDGPHGPARVSCSIDVGPPLPRWVRLWFWIFLPGFVTVLFCLHQFLKWQGERDRQIAAAKPGQPSLVL